MAARHAAAATVLGELTLVAEDDELTGLYFPHHWTRPGRAAFGTPVSADGDPLFDRVTAELAEYLAGDRTGFTVPARTSGSPFQERVWALLRAIPYGQTTSYGALAERLGDRTLAREVGQAVGRNPVSVIVPCHRVIGADGRLTGYAGGLERKRLLLEREGAIAAEAPALF